MGCPEKRMSRLLFKVNPDLDPIPSYFLKDLALLVISTQLFSDYFSLKKYSNTPAGSWQSLSPHLASRFLERTVQVCSLHGFIFLFSPRCHSDKVFASLLFWNCSSWGGPKVLLPHAAFIFHLVLSPLFLIEAASPQLSWAHSRWFPSLWPSLHSTLTAVLQGSIPSSRLRSRLWLQSYSHKILLSF